jgi:hypothetical protein
VKIGSQPQNTFRIPPEKLATIPCPNLRTLVNEGWLTPDKDGLVEITQLDAALKRLGVEGLPRKILDRGAEKATKEAVAQQLGDMASGKFNIYRLRGSNLDHAGDLRILRGETADKLVDKERVAWLCSFATNGRIGIAEMARAGKEAARDEGAGFRAKALAVAELTAIVKVYGTPDATGRKTISVEGVRDLWERSRFPAEWRARLEDDPALTSVSPQKTGLFRLVAGVVEMAFRQLGTSSGRARMGMDIALDKDTQLNQTSAMGLANGMCPAGPPVTIAKAQADLAHAS